MLSKETRKLKTHIMLTQIINGKILTPQGWLKDRAVADALIAEAEALAAEAVRLEAEVLQIVESKIG